MFADAEGKKGGQFYTPQSIVKILVDMLAPEPEKRQFMTDVVVVVECLCKANALLKCTNTEKAKFSIYGQESNPTT
jgi:type I restriction enzyme M protein